MVEGHQCHRVAHAHRRSLVGHKFKAHSPNQRFTEGAAAITGKPLYRIEVHGKQLFYFFGDKTNPVVMQIHFGMSGAFRTMTLEKARETRETTRLVLEDTTAGLLAHLSAMTVQYGDQAFYEEMSAKLGPDPLREDADGEKLWAKMQASRKPVGLILMDQAAVAGIGNIYRAEILFKAGVHPEQPCNTVDRAAFDRLWHHSVTLLQRGFKSGSILTVDPEEAAVLGPPWTRRYIYNHAACGRCGTKVSTWDMAARTVYACETCQPLTEGTVLSPQRTSALSAAHPTKEFKSHCAPEEAVSVQNLTIVELKQRLASLGITAAKQARKPQLVEQLQALMAGKAEAAEGAAAASQESEPEEEAAVSTPPVSPPAEGAVVIEQHSPASPAEDFQKLTVAQLKDRLKELKLPLGGRKPELLARLSQSGPPDAEPQAVASPDASHITAVQAHVTSPEEGERAERQGSGQVLEAAVEVSSEGRQAAPGTAQLEAVASAEAAEAEKAAAGEGRNVEHVALHEDTASRDTADAAPKPKRRKRGSKQTQPQPGTAQLDAVASAQAAEAEKTAAGEGRNVEHVALHEDHPSEAPAARPTRRNKAKHGAQQQDPGTDTAIAPDTAQPKRKRRGRQ
ncbi:hypothetical protein WJX73_006548 [Symbiochloris irregularis]|uniref:DNA-(apurinic or apyrimidinic site) lyase n=1 Tax=Symbiochloris irregularis TaxID=706552 RepID=A0AAW1NQU9_9CHLO